MADAKEFAPSVSLRDEIMKRLMVIPAVVVALFSAATASASCDETCVLIKRVLDARSNGFANFKGAATGHDGTMWNANVAPLGLHCFVENETAPTAYSRYKCNTLVAEKTSKARADQIFAAVMSAFREIEPQWKWFKVRGSELDLYGGPAKGSFLVDFSSDGTLGIYNIDLTINSLPLSTRFPLEPYQP